MNDMILPFYSILIQELRADYSLSNQSKQSYWMSQLSCLFALTWVDPSLVTIWSEHLFSNSVCRYIITVVWYGFFPTTQIAKCSNLMQPKLPISFRQYWSKLIFSADLGAQKRPAIKCIMSDKTGKIATLSLTQWGSETKSRQMFHTSRYIEDVNLLAYWSNVVKKHYMVSTQW